MRRIGSIQNHMPCILDILICGQYIWSNEKNLSWSAGTTYPSKLPKEQRKNYLGLVIPEDERKRIQEMIMVSGNNWTTPIRDQSGCGACVAFATVAMIKSNLEIFRYISGTWHPVHTYLSRLAAGPELDELLNGEHSS